MSKTNYERNRALDARYGGGTYVKPATVYLALFTAAPGVGGGGTEVAGGSYARQAITNDAANFPNAVAGAKSNANAVTFPGATVAWGTIGWAAIFDALTGGNMQDFAPLTAPKTVQIGDVIQFAAGSIALQET